MSFGWRCIAGGLVALSLTAVGALAGSAGAVDAAPDLIVNGSFETPDIPVGTFAIFPTIPGWSHEARPGTTSSGIEIQDHVAGAPAAGAGDQFAALDSDGPSHIFQDVATTPGSTYRLTFLYSAAPNTVAAQNHFEVSAGPSGLVIGPFAGAGQTDWLVQTLDFVATASSSRIEFRDLGPEDSPGSGVGAYIDAVAVTLINSPPDCSAVRASPDLIDPATRELRLVTLSGASDPDGDALRFRIDGVAQDEPMSGAGIGDDTSPDAQLTPAGADSNQVLVRAERNPKGNGRVYRIAFAVLDGNGGSCQASFAETTARVEARRKKGVAAIDDFATTRFDSFTGAALP